MTKHLVATFNRKEKLVGGRHFKTPLHGNGAYYALEYAADAQYLQCMDHNSQLRVGTGTTR